MHAGMLYIRWIIVKNYFLMHRLLSYAYTRGWFNIICLPGRTKWRRFKRWRASL